MSADYLTVGEKPVPVYRVCWEYRSGRHLGLRAAPGDGEGAVPERSRWEGLWAPRTFTKWWKTPFFGQGDNWSPRR